MGRRLPRRGFKMPTTTRRQVFNWTMDGLRKRSQSPGDSGERGSWSRALLNADDEDGARVFYRRCTESTCLESHGASTPHTSGGEISDSEIPFADVLPQALDRLYEETRTRRLTNFCGATLGEHEQNLRKARDRIHVLEAVIRQARLELNGV